MFSHLLLNINISFNKVLMELLNSYISTKCGIDGDPFEPNQSIMIKGEEIVEDTEAFRRVIESCMWIYEENNSIMFQKESILFIRLRKRSQPCEQFITTGENIWQLLPLGNPQLRQLILFRLLQNNNGLFNKSLRLGRKKMAGIGTRLKPINSEDGKQ